MGMFVLGLTALAVPALAQGAAPCAGSATWTTGLEITDRDLGEGKVVVVPRAATVTWAGSIDLNPPPTEPRAASGWVKIKLPFPLGSQTVGKWSDTGTTISNSGSYDYDFPAVFAGFKVPVTGKHWEGTLNAKGEPTCEGAATVQIEGTNPAGFITGGLAVLSFVGVFISVKAVGPSAGGSKGRDL
jgi:hypothetical protein